jgi:hypothetical protein
LLPAGAPGERCVLAGVARSLVHAPQARKAGHIR